MSESRPSNASLSHYRIISRLGAGGMGEVFLAEDTHLGRRVAVKVLPAVFTGDAERLRRFEQEAKAASALNHPNIITIHEIGHVGGEHFIVTEYIAGRTLRERLHDAMKLTEALDIAAQAAGALAAAHEAGIVHRDIKPENLMLRPDGYVKVLDFGLAKLVEQRPAEVNSLAPTVAKLDTEPGVLLGTVQYMSPEQARGLQVDSRSDIFSLGVVLYEMVAGRRPFDGATKMDVILAIVDREPPPLAERVPDAPEELERIVSQALRKDRAARYQDIKDLLRDLKDLKQELEFRAKLARAAPSDAGVQASIQGPASGGVRQTEIETARLAAVPTGQESVARTASNAEHVAGEIRRHKRGVIVALLLLAVAAAAAYFIRQALRPRAITSIAVLPFLNVSGDKADDHLSDGLSESLIDALSALPDLKVIARSSSFRYRGSEVDPQETARVLGVEALVMGRVTRRGDELQVRAELVDAGERANLWSRQYNRRADDLLAVQAEIAEEVAGKLRARPMTGGPPPVARSGTDKPEAYELFLKGRYFRHLGGAANRRQAVAYLNQAVAFDPKYAAAYAQLAANYRLLADAGAVDPKEGMPRAEAAALRALDLDPNLAEARLALANVRLNALRWEDAEREYRRAVELNPNFAQAHSGYSYYLSLVGRHDEAIAAVRRAKELDPLSPGVSADIGYRLFFARRYDEAAGALKQALELERGDPAVYHFLALVYTAQRRYPDALAAYDEAIKLGGDGPSLQIYLGYTSAKAGEAAKARAILKQLEATNRYVSPAELAVLLAALGEREQALASLEKAQAAHDLQLQFLGVDPGYDALRDEPRFKDLMNRTGLSGVTPGR
jgi:eukaryotic-like serine/threonine-protein kinase